MDNPQRLLMIASPLMRRTPVYDRAAALAKAKGMALHIVAFDYLEALATAGLVNDQVLAVMRDGYVRQHREWLESPAEGQTVLLIESTYGDRQHPDESTAHYLAKVINETLHPVLRLPGRRHAGCR